MRTGWRVALMALLAVLLVGCGAVRYPAKGGGAAAVAYAPCDRNQAGPGQVVVCKGDTLMEIARVKDVTVANLKRANGLSSDHIEAGWRLILPDESVYTVQAGDTLLEISRRTGVSRDALIAANNLTNPNHLLPERRLAIPRSSVQVAAAARQPVAAARPQVGPVTAPTPSVTIGRPIPAAGPAAAAPPQTSPPPAVATVEAPSSPQPRARPAETKPRAQPKPTASAPKSSAAAGPKATAAAGLPHFILPVEGRIVGDFGPQSGGLHNDGINIAAPRGTPIHATADGSVAYAGDGLPGFGNLILIKHAEGWTSAYAHAATLTVKRGDSVRQGQTVGTVGNTGSVSEPQLHFELRQHDQAIDPKKAVR